MAKGTVPVSRQTLLQLMDSEAALVEELRQVREAVGEKIKAEREGLGLSLEGIQSESGNEIVSSNLSRLERGQSWSAELAQKAVAFMARRSKKNGKPAKTAKAGT